MKERGGGGRLLETRAIVPSKDISARRAAYDLIRCASAKISLEGEFDLCLKFLLAAFRPAVRRASFWGVAVIRSLSRISGATRSREFRFIRGAIVRE